MVICCVPKCGSDSWKCDTSITFHDFPSNPDLAAKWIKQINSAVKIRPMWFPRGKPVVCSKHFLQTDFKGDTDSLKPRCIPTVFGHKYIGQNADPEEGFKNNEPKKSPLIVKVNKPQECVIENDSTLRISDVHTKASFNDVKNIGSKPETAVHHKELKTPSVMCRNNIQNSNRMSNNCATLTANFHSGALNRSRKIEGANGINVNNLAKLNPVNELNSLSKKTLKKKEKNNSDLIEIGPNTFLKINPDIIKVNKKLTPSGNTVLQFLMDQKLAKSHGSNILPKLIQGISPSSDQRSNSVDATEVEESNNNNNNTDKDKLSNPIPQKETVVQHVLGHLVDTHVCEESCADLKLIDDENGNNESIQDNSKTSESIPQCGTSTEKQDVSSDINENKKSTSNTDSSFIEKAPVLLTTNMPLSHCFIDKPKYILQLKQKSRQIASLKFKVANLTKKIEELEDRCIVQERQLSYSFIKRLKTIRKNAAKGDPSATYILEQIRSYSNNSKMRWSDSTLTQCAMWCRKAPYAYEYFKKAEFFKLPCLGTVKRYMKKHPELKFQKKTTKYGPQQEDDDESSSDFDFDESDGQNDANALTDDGNDEPVTCETILSVPSDLTNPAPIQPVDVKGQNEKQHSESKPKMSTDQSSKFQKEITPQNSLNNKAGDENHSEASNCVESSGIPVTVDGSNLELQEIILPSGDVVQCYSSNVSNGTDIGSQYFIIPNVSDQSCNVDHEYSVVQTDSLPVILQNFDNSQLHLQQQDQLIFIANSSDQVECSETEVTSA